MSILNLNESQLESAGIRALSVAESEIQSTFIERDQMIAKIDEMSRCRLWCDFNGNHKDALEIEKRIQAMISLMKKENSGMFYGQTLIIEKTS